jgi:hypothetical protein
LAERGRDGRHSEDGIQTKNHYNKNENDFPLQIGIHG